MWHNATIPHRSKRVGGPILQHAGRTDSSGHGITRNPSSWWSSHFHWQRCGYIKTTMVSESRLLTGRAQGQGLWHHPWHLAWTQDAIRIILANSFCKCPHSLWRPTPWRGSQTGSRRIRQKKVTTKTLCIQEAGPKRWFSTGLTTQKSQNHTLSANASRRTKRRCHGKLDHERLTLKNS